MSVHPTAHLFSPSEPTRPTIAPTLAIWVPSVHPTVLFSFPFLLGFDPCKIHYPLNLACGILAFLGPRNVYKDMLNIMVSLIDHVVMNHQNQTRTNGKWGHVRYNLPLFGDLCQHKQSKHKFAKIEKIRTTYCRGQPRGSPKLPGASCLKLAKNRSKTHLLLKRTHKARPMLRWPPRPTGVAQSKAPSSRFRAGSASLEGSRLPRAGSASLEGSSLPRSRLPHKHACSRTRVREFNALTQ
jgi:hypothetical protein